MFMFCCSVFVVLYLTVCKFVMSFFRCVQSLMSCVFCSCECGVVSTFIGDLVVE